jgi:HK97 family phage portal protein
MKKNRIQRAWATLRKAIFGEPAKPRASKITVNTNYADYTLTSSAYETWVQEAYKDNETINGALNLIINTFTEAPIQVVDKDGDVLEDHPTSKLLNHINDNSSRLKFLKTLLLDMYIGDVGYIEKVFSIGGKITELGILRPDRVRIFADEEKFIDHYSYEVAGHTIVLQPDEVIALQFIDPSDVYGGFSPLKALAKRIDSDNESTDHAVTMLQNRGQPGSIITVPDPIDASEAEALARSWDNRFSGDRNGQTGVLWGGMQYNPFGMSMKDLDFSGLKSIDEAKILSTLRIPTQVYGSITGASASTFNNMKEARKQFWEQAIIPLQTMVEDALNNDSDITDNFTVTVRFDRSNVEALQENANEAAERCSKLYQTGVITLNEARTKLGFDDRSGGDELFSPFSSMIPTDDGEDKLEDMKLDMLTSSKEVRDTILEERNSKDPVVVNITNEVKESIKEDIVPIEPEMTQKALEDDLRAQLQIALGREGLANKFLLETLKMADRHLKRHISSAIEMVGQKAHKIVKTFETNRLEGSLNELSEEWKLALEADSLSTLGRLVEESAKASSAGVGVAIDIDSIGIKQAVKTQTLQFASKVAGTSDKQVREVIQSAFTEGKSLGELTEDLKSLGAGWSDTRASMIARTETSRAANFGARIGYQQSKVVEKLMYSAILDGNTSEICSSLNGKIVGINEHFLTQEEGFVGSNGKPVSLSYSDGVQEPPAHPNCRSTIIPIIEQKNEAGEPTYKVMVVEELESKCCKENNEQ